MPLPRFPLAPPLLTPRAAGDLLLSLSAARALPQGQQLHAHLIKSGSTSSFSLLSNHLITFYARCRHPCLSRAAFLDAPLRSPVTWSSLIAALAHNSLPADAILAFRSMLADSISASNRTISLSAKSVAALSPPNPTLAASLHGLAAKTPFSPDVFVNSSLVDMYGKCGLLHHARRLFDEMPMRNVVSWSAMIYGYSEGGQGDEAIQIFKRAIAGELPPPGANDFVYSCIVRVCGSAALLELGSQIHGRCFKSGNETSPFVGSALVSLYSKCGIVNDAYKVFDETPDRNLGLWNAILKASALHGHTHEVFSRLKEMERYGIEQNFITYLSVLTACSHAGLVDEGRRYFDRMMEKNIDPGAEHYACMVDLLGRSGRLREAVRFVESMPIEPTESVWGALLTGCRIHGDADTAEFAASSLFASGSKSSGAHMLLASAYAAAGRLAEAARTRREMRDRGVKKETGLSWIEHGGWIYTFASGDARFARMAEVEAVLEEMKRRMEEEGYVADLSGVTREVDGEEKRRSVWRHSERLAIAFGLILMPDVGRTIRVMKNLRVCGDCHVAVKYMSKVTGRVLILRDNNRFHRFEAGECSCRDYW